jgi:hydrogenase expression/formation protein HypD
VCVTPMEKIDAAIELAARPEVIFCSFGDMLRVPGTDRDLLAVKAAGGDVRIVYSPLDAVRLARENPGREVVFFAVGFETTAPANAMPVYQARREGIGNFSILVSQVLVPPAMEAILSSPKCRVQGFLAAGHVCAVMGFKEYVPIATRHHVPIVVTGFEPLDLLQGIYMCLSQLEEGRAEVENQYSRVVTEEGNRTAQQIMNEVFEIVDRNWRGIGEIRRSGLGLRPQYRSFDAEQKFTLTRRGPAVESSECLSGLVLQGLLRPPDCPLFGTRCTPEHPIGATMVSSEGACAAYYLHRRGSGGGRRDAEREEG